MKVGFVGLGKLGLPCAVSTSLTSGNEVMGYDVNPRRMTTQPQDYREAGPAGEGDFNDWLKDSPIKFGSLQEVCDHAEIIFLAVQTPHQPAYEGVTRIPPTRADFDYTWLKGAVKDTVACITKPTVLAVISTCLPGTMEREIRPLLSEHTSLVYNPFFIAMGTTMRDFLDPEFILLGVDDPEAAQLVERFYATVTTAPVCRMSVESAELTKVCYNTYISAKIAVANTIMEICDAIPKADCDEVVDALSMGHRRIISPAYMRGGMGDGGGCHPRDNIAMSWLARELGLSFDLFDSIMMCREKQAEWLAHLCLKGHVGTGLPVIILGYAFKPGTDLTVGSPAELVASLIRETGTVNPILIDAHVEPGMKLPPYPAVILVGCKHPEYADMNFFPGSIVIDPFRMVKSQLGVNVVRLGEKQ